MLVKTLALEWGSLGVRVMSIWPGPIEGTEGMERLAADPEMRKKIEARLPLGRYGTKDEVAQLALFLASPSRSHFLRLKSANRLHRHAFSQYLRKQCHVLGVTVLSHEAWAWQTSCRLTFSKGLPKCV